MLKRNQLIKRCVLIGALCFSTLLPAGCGEQDESSFRPEEDLAREKTVTEEVPASWDEEKQDVNRSDDMESEKSETEDNQTADP